MTGADHVEDVRVNLKGPVVVRDVYTGEKVPLKVAYDETDSFRVVTLRNGRRHALSFTIDSTIAYRTLDLRRNWWGALNVYNGGLGFAVDQLLESSYHIDPEFLSKFTFNTLTPEQKKIIEDSLRHVEQFVYPSSLIDGRTFMVVSGWVGTGIAGKSGAQLAFPNIGIAGVGLAPIPYFMVLYEIGSLSIYDNVYVEDLYNVRYTNISNKSIGICIQEPRFGLFGSWRYGVGDIEFRYEGDSTEAVTFHGANTTQYSLGFGFYGQFGRFEFRHTRLTSFDTAITEEDVQTVLNGIYWTVHVML